MLAVPSAAASAMNQTTGVDRTAGRASEMTSVSMPTTLRRQPSATLAENGHDGGSDEKRGHTPMDVTPLRSDPLALNRCQPAGGGGGNGGAPGAGGGTGAPSGGAAGSGRNCTRPGGMLVPGGGAVPGSASPSCSFGIWPSSPPFSIPARYMSMYRPNH